MEAIDDDFGELYADVEVQATSAINGISDFARLYIEPEKDYGNGAKDKDVELKENFVSDEKKVDSACGEDSTHSGSEGVELNSVKEVNDYIESDSEDDLNIVLNDEDCQDFPVGVGGNRGVVTGVSYDEDDDGDFVAEGSNLGKNGNYGDRLAGGSELVTCNGHSGQSKNGVKRGYGSQFFLHKVLTLVKCLKVRLF
ncbi:hypothetical protein L6164_013664 [Bauhinia variegata]|uniref:Uncharacterized protein n=1 Tax=Bauhinia variegata TaxID=167791 RepID=A0ACB9NFM9_BAUVA|nr:hypothetical protein L6164_013664 [Bauhinia variegata]